MTPRSTRRGTVLIVTMFIITMLAGLVLVLCQSMRVEAVASANEAASIQAAAIARGAERYVLSLLGTEADAVRELPPEYFAAVPVGEGWFWIVRPDYNDRDLPVFGLTDENAKLNINSASYDAILRLPYMTEDIAAAIVDWRDTDTTPRANGAENEYYLSQPQGYSAKNAPFETLEELLLVRGITPDVLWGDGTAPPLGNSAAGGMVIGGGGSALGDVWLSRGLGDLLTIYSSEPPPAASDDSGSGGGGGSGSGTGTDTGTQGLIDINDRNQRNRDSLRQLLTDLISSNRANEIIGRMGNDPFRDIFDFYFRVQLTAEELDLIADSITARPRPQQGESPPQPQAVKGKINVNTAPREVLLTLATDNLTDQDIDKLIEHRRANQGSSEITPTSIGWVAEALEQKAIGLGDRITGKSYQWTADIIAASGNGRAYKRIRIVVDTTAGAQIVYRRDLTEKGWPMDPMVLASIRAGQGPGNWAFIGTNMR